LFDAGDSVSELPLPVIPETVWNISKEPVPGRGYFTWRFLLQVTTDAVSTWRFLLQIIRNAALAWGLLRVVVAATV
jgi:hypothetical protein